MSDKTKHTPGPWSIDPDDGGPWYCVREPGGGWIAQVPEPDSADARLVAAAPEMLEALRAIVYRPRTSRPRKDDNAARDIAVSALDQITRLRGDLEDAIDQATRREVTP